MNHLTASGGSLPHAISLSLSTYESSGIVLERVPSLDNSSLWKYLSVIEVGLFPLKLSSTDPSCDCYDHTAQALPPHQLNLTVGGMMSHSGAFTTTSEKSKCFQPCFLLCNGQDT